MGVIDNYWCLNSCLVYDGLLIGNDEFVKTEIRFPIFEFYLFYNCCANQERGNENERIRQSNRLPIRKEQVDSSS